MGQANNLSHFYNVPVIYAEVCDSIKQAILANPGITLNDLAKAANTTEDKVRLALDYLVSKGFCQTATSSAYESIGQLCAWPNEEGSTTNKESEASDSSDSFNLTNDELLVLSYIQKAVTRKTPLLRQDIVLDCVASKQITRTRAYFSLVELERKKKITFLNGGRSKQVVLIASLDDSSSRLEEATRQTTLVEQVSTSTVPEVNVSLDSKPNLTSELLTLITKLEARVSALENTIASYALQLKQECSTIYGNDFLYAGGGGINYICDWEYDCKIGRVVSLSFAADTSIDLTSYKAAHDEIVAYVEVVAPRLLADGHSHVSTSAPAKNPKYK